VKPRRDQPRVRGGGEVIAGAIVTSLEARLQKKIDLELPLIVTASKAGVKEKLRNLLRSMPGESLFPCEAECCYDGGSDHLRPKTMNRREFLTWARRAALAAPAAVLGYGLFEASWFHVARHTIAIPNLPAAFDGLTIALLTDLHHGRFTSLHYIRTIVEVTNAQQADIIALGGDYAHAHRRYIPPCLEMLAELKARLGVFGVLGNHDHWYDARLTRECMRRSHIADLTNTGYWLLRGTSRLRIGGVDDFWEGAQELSAALGDASADETCILLSHNPDYVETISDRRVGLVLSGHTHGGADRSSGSRGTVCSIDVRSEIPARPGANGLHAGVRFPGVSDDWSSGASGGQTRNLVDPPDDADIGHFAPCVMVAELPCSPGPQLR
jgi:predicted MPP superfamily phosphohydrolase